MVGPFAFDDLPVLLSPVESRDPEPFNRLHAWLSAAGEGRWESFVRVARVLGAAPDLSAARQLFRRFVLLGHLEPDGRDWSLAPPVIVRTAACSRTVFWCGSRGAALQKALPAALKQEESEPQPDGFGPSRWTIHLAEGSPGTELPVCTSPPTWATPVSGGAVAERLTALLPNISEWKESLVPDEWTIPPDAIELWDLQAGRFQTWAGTLASGPAGMYRLTYGEAPRTYQTTIFFDPQAAADRRMLQGDWHGLRFLALHHSGKYLKAPWKDESGGLLAVPYRQRWPLMYERVLVLASGFLPCRHPENGFLYYQGIPETLAKNIAGHLGVEVVTAAQVEV